MTSVVQVRDARKYVAFAKAAPRVPKTKAEMRRELREAVENTARMTPVQQEGDEYV